MLTALCLLLCSIPAAAEETPLALPERPPPPAAQEGDLPEEVGVTAGEPLPPGLVLPNGRAAFTFVAVPPAPYADLLKTEVWARELDWKARLILAAQEERIRAERERSADARKHVIVTLVAVTGGIVVGAGGIYLAADALSRIPDVP